MRPSARTMWALGLLVSVARPLTSPFQTSQASPIVNWSLKRERFSSKRRGAPCRRGSAEVEPSPANHGGNQPLAWVPVVPNTTVAVVGLEGVVVVVVALAVSEERQPDRVAGGVLIRVRLGSEHVGPAVDQEGRVLDEDDAHEAGPEHHRQDVARHDAQQQRHEQVESDADGQVVAVLPSGDWILQEIAHVAEVAIELPR